MTTNGSYIVSWDFSHVTDDENTKNRAVLIVGKQTKGVMNIVNAFSGQEAIDIYEKLTTIQERE